MGYEILTLRCSETVIFFCLYAFWIARIQKAFRQLLDFLQQWSFHKILLFFSKSLQYQVPLGLASCVCLQAQVSAMFVSVK